LILILRFFVTTATRRQSNSQKPVWGAEKKLKKNVTFFLRGSLTVMYVLYSPGGLGVWSGDWAL
jgi:hypothetical protein